MMDVEKLIKQLRSAAKLEAYYNSEYNGLTIKPPTASKSYRLSLSR